MLSDIEIAQSAKMQPVVEIAEGLGIKEEELEFYGRYKAQGILRPVGKGEGHP